MSVWGVCMTHCILGVTPPLFFNVGSLYSPGAGPLPPLSWEVGGITGGRGDGGGGGKGGGD